MTIVDFTCDIHRNLTITAEMLTEIHEDLKLRNMILMYGRGMLSPDQMDALIEKIHKMEV